MWLQQYVLYYVTVTTQTTLGKESCPMLLDLKNKFIPVSTSHTQSGSDTGGAPEKDVKTDAGEASEEKRDNKK